MKRTIRDVDLKNKKVLLRVDFNVPLDANGNVSDDKRIVAALPTINYLIKQGCKVIIVSHLGRPNGFDKSLSMLPVAKRLIELVECKVFVASDVVGPDAKAKAAKLKCGQILVLENVRFEKGEEENDENLAKELASLAEFYVNDAFGTAHRKHASTYGVAKLLPNALGFLMGKETNTITCAMEKPDRPFVAVMGGSKVADKIGMLQNLLTKADVLLVGGAMAFTFLKAQGKNVGLSKVDDEGLQTAIDLLKYAENMGKTLVLPVDVVCAKKIDKSARARKFSVGKIPTDQIGLDIGPKTQRIFTKHIKCAHTVIWNGPMGVFEIPKFEKGTKKVALALTKVKGTTIVGGGDSALAAKFYGISKKVTHVSTGGGATLKLLEGKVLPCVDVISDMEEK